jgi:predicted DNA-binding transcriptional regulator AlpA
MEMTYITFNQLQSKLGNRSRSSVYRDLEAGRLPRPVKLGSRLYWREDEIDAALAALAEGAKK